MDTVGYDTIKFKKCNTCSEIRSVELYYKSKRVNGLVNTCKICHRKRVRSYRKVKGAYNWWYKRLEKIKKRARIKGLEFNLTVDELKKIKESAECYYCRTKTDVITLERMDNDKGYIIGNVLPVCYICNKLKSNIPFNLEEMRLIGQVVASYNKRTGAVDKVGLDIENGEDYND